MGHRNLTIFMYLIGEGVHDDVVGYDAQGVDLLHEDVGRDQVEVDELEEGGEYLGQLLVGGVAVLFAPHQGGLELGELVRLELVPGQDQPDHVLGQQGERAQVQHLVPVLVHKLQHLSGRGRGSSPIRNMQLNFS